MAKQQNAPKHHHFSSIPASMRSYLSQLEAALVRSDDERDKLDRRVTALKGQLEAAERKWKVRS